MKTRLFVFLLCCFVACSHLQVKAVAVSVNENVELMSVLSRLSGYQEYCMDVAGAYINDLDSCFGKYSEHPAIAYMKELRDECGIAYDAVMSMAVRLCNDDGRFSLLEEDSDGLDARWGGADKEKFLSLLSSFYADSGFRSFFEAHDSFYRVGLHAYEDSVLKHFDEKWYESFYGKEPEETFNVIIGFVNGYANYGPSRQLKGMKKEVFAIVGYEVDESGTPRYNRNYLSTLVHEFNHSFVNYLLDAEIYSDHADALEDASGFLLESSLWSMRSQAYNFWKTVINESLVRAAVICYMLDNGYPKEEVEAEMLSQIGRNFRWMPELVALLKSYRAQQAEYGTFENFYPRVISFFNGYADRERLRLNAVFD